MDYGMSNHIVPERVLRVEAYDSYEGRITQRWFTRDKKLFWEPGRKLERKFEDRNPEAVNKNMDVSSYTKCRLTRIRTAVRKYSKAKLVRIAET